MALRRRGVQIGATIDLYTGGRAAVAFAASPGRWPEHELADRLSLVVAIPAIAMDAVEPSGEVWLREELRRMARILSAPANDAPGAPEPEVTVVSSAGPGDLRIELQLLRSATGPSPSLGGRDFGIQSLALAAEAVALVGFDAAPRDVRLAAALSLEGVLAWFHDGTGHRPEAQAMAYALAYAVARLEGAGRPVPAALTAAIEG